MSKLEKIIICKNCKEVFILQGDEPSEYTMKRRFEMKTLLWELGARAHIINCIEKKINNFEQKYIDNRLKKV